MTSRSWLVADIDPHVISVPCKHEAKALTDVCDECAAPTRPASVLDVVTGLHIRCRVASYRCGCDHAWLSEWPDPGLSRQRFGT